MIDYPKKLPATTLPETLVALLLLSISFSIGMIIYLNVIQTNTPYLKTKMHTLLKAELATTINQQAYFNRTYEKDGFTIQRDIQAYHTDEDVYLVILKAERVEGKQVMEIKKLVYQQ